MTDNKITMQEVYDLFSTADLVDGDNLTQCDAPPATEYPDQVDTKELVTSLMSTNEDMPPLSQMPAAKRKKHLKRPQTTTATVEQVKRPRTPKPKKTSTSRQTSQGKSTPSTSQGTLEVSGLMLHETQSLVEEVAMMMNEFLELLRMSNSQRFVNTLLANQRNTCLSRFMSKEATEILERFLVRYIHANDEQIFLSNSEKNKHLSSPNTMSSTSHTITASTSVPGPSQPAAVEDSTAARLDSCKTFPLCKQKAYPLARMETEALKRVLLHHLGGPRIPVYCEIAGQLRRLRCEDGGVLENPDCGPAPAEMVETRDTQIENRGGWQNPDAEQLTHVDTPSGEPMVGQKHWSTSHTRATTNDDTS